MRRAAFGLKMTGDESGSIVPLQNGKTYCAAFCASLALLAGSGNKMQAAVVGKRGRL